MKIRNQFSMSRRQLLAGAGSTVAALAAPALVKSARAAGGPLVFVAYGGATQAGMEKHIIDVFQADTGIEVIRTTGPDLGKMAAQIQTGNLEWDVLCLTGGQAMNASRRNFLEDIDYSGMEAADFVVKPHPQAMPFFLSSSGIAFDPARHPEGKHPTTWAEFWDVEKIQGRRGLRRRAEGNLEAALLADGVPASELYPLDVDRAFKSLDRLKPHVTRWIGETPQTITLIQNNEIDFVGTWGGLVEAAQRTGVSIDYVYKNNLWTSAYMSIMKGTANKDAAQKLLHYFNRPDLQAAYNNEMRYGVTNKKAVALLKPDVAKIQPDPSDPNTVFQDDVWWAENLDKTELRFKKWLLA